MLKDKLSVPVYHKLKYFKNFKKFPNLNEPKTITEIIVSQIINGEINKNYKLADKILAKEYVEEIVGKEVIVPTIKIWDTADEIDIDLLPEQFVIKTNNASGTCYFCRDKSEFDIEECKSSVNKWLAYDYGYHLKEPHYSEIKPRVYAENIISKEMLEKEYKFFCFSGVPYFVVVYDKAIGKEKFYYMDWTETDFRFVSSTIDSVSYEKPANFSEMKDLASKLSKNLHFSRIDMYSDGTNILFGEITLTPKGGYLSFIPSKYNTYFKNVYDEEIRKYE